MPTAKFSEPTPEHEDDARDGLRLAIASELRRLRHVCENIEHELHLPPVVDGNGESYQYVQRRLLSDTLNIAVNLDAKVSAALFARGEV
jgi:hypothetical protein